jgi:hypothetical protein
MVATAAVGGAGAAAAAAAAGGVIEQAGLIGDAAQAAVRQRIPCDNCTIV